MDDGCFRACVYAWISWSVNEWQFTDGCSVSGVILALLITRWRECEVKLYNTTAESGETHTYAHLLLPNSCLSNPPNFSYRITNHLLSVRAGWKTQFGLQPLLAAYRSQWKCSFISLKYRQVWAYRGKTQRNSSCLGVKSDYWQNPT